MCQVSTPTTQPDNCLQSIPSISQILILHCHFIIHLGEELLPVCHGPDKLGLGGDEAGEQPLAGVDEGPAQLPPTANVEVTYFF